MLTDTATEDLNVAGRNEDAMKVLARHLANNYFDVTFRHRPRKEYKDFYPRVIEGGSTRDLSAEPQVRNILVVGAGLSFAAFGSEMCPLALPAIGKLKGTLQVDALQRALRIPDMGKPKVRDRFEEEEELIRQLHGIPEPDRDFESQLMILSKFYTARQIREGICDLYSHRYHPHIIFETIAHLLKHRFIDVVINYNFDELLDQAVREELRGGDRSFVIFDGDIEPFPELLDGQQLKKPIYIKPHGTASHKSSLRFTKDAYVGMPADLLEFTRRLLHGDTQEDQQKQRSRVDVNLISIGFAFNSVELVNVLQGHERLSIFHVNTPGLESSEAFKQQARKLPAATRHYFINVGDDTSRAAWPTLQDAVEALHDRVSDAFTQPYRPRHLARHQLVHDVLFASGTGRRGAPLQPAGAGERVPTEDDDYFRARLLLELTIALAKGRGRLDLAGLVGDRVGTYFRLFHQYGGKDSLRSLCEQLGLEKDDGFAGNVYTVNRSDITQPPASGLPGVDEKLVPHWPLARLLWHNLIAELKLIQDGPLRNHLTRLAHEPIIQKLATLAESDAHELTPRFEADAMLLLNEPTPKRVIPTALGLSTQLESLFKNERWRLALLVTERAKILPKLKAHAGAECRANVIVAQPLDRAALDEHLDEHAHLLIGERYELPYWAHNDHMVLLLERTGEEERFRPLGAVSYQKRGLEHRVTPVYIEDRDDLDHLVMTYFGYVVKAEGVGSWGGVPDVGFAKAKQKRDELFEEWWKEMSPHKRVPPASRARGPRKTRRG